MSVYVKFKKLFGVPDEDAAALGLHELVMKDVSTRDAAQLGGRVSGRC